MCPVHDPNGITRFLKMEPSRAVALALAIIGVASSFGLGLTDGQQSAIVALVGAILALVGGETVRSQVTPVAKLEDEPAPAPFVAPAAPVKKAAAKKAPAKKAAPKTPDGLS